MFAQSISANATSFGQRISANDILNYREVSRNAWRSVSLRTGKEEIRELRKEMMVDPNRAISKALGVPTHASHTITQIFILTMTQRYFQNQRINIIQGQNDKNKGIGSAAIKTGYDMVNSFDIYSSMIGAGIFSKYLGPAAAAMQTNLKQQGFGKAFSNFMGAAMGTFITFAGWELGAQLWQEAIYNLDNEEEIVDALQLNFDKIFLKQASEKETKLFTKVMDNILLMFFFQRPQMFKDLIRNTWSLRMETGHFTTLMASMILGAQAGAVVGSVIPGIGTGVCGFAGGMAGGFLWLAIPHSVNDAITLAYKENRVKSAEQRLDANNNEILRIASLFEQGKGTRDPIKQMQMLKTVFDRRQAIRNDGMSAYFFLYNEAFTRKRMAEDLLTMLDQYQQMDPKKVVLTASESELAEVLDGDRSFKMYTIKNFQELQQIQREEQHNRDAALAEMKRIEDKMVQFYYDEAVNRLGTLLYKSSAINENMQAVIIEEIARISWIHKVIRLIVLGQSPERRFQFGMDEMPPEIMRELSKRSEVQITAARLRGYSEDRFKIPEEKKSINN